MALVPPAHRTGTCSLTSSSIPNHKGRAKRRPFPRTKDPTMRTGLQLFAKDALVTEWCDPCTHRHYRQGKRVPANCPLPRDAIRIYVKRNSIAAVKFLHDNHNMTLSAAWELIKIARGAHYRYIGGEPYLRF